MKSGTDFQNLSELLISKPTKDFSIIQESSTKLKHDEILANQCYTYKLKDRIVKVIKHDITKNDEPDAATLAQVERSDDKLKVQMKRVSYDS